MAAIFKILANTATLTANSNVSQARLVYVYNGNTTASVTILHHNEANVQFASIVVGFNQSVVIEKKPNEYFSTAGTPVSVTPIAFKN